MAQYNSPFQDYPTHTITIDEGDLLQFSPFRNTFTTIKQTPYLSLERPHCQFGYQVGIEKWSALAGQIKPPLHTETKGLSVTFCGISYGFNEHCIWSQRLVELRLYPWNNVVVQQLYIHPCSVFVTSCHLHQPNTQGRSLSSCWALGLSLWQCIAWLSCGTNTWLHCWSSL